MKVKIFDTSSIPGGRSLEGDINEWIAAVHISRIIEIKATNSGTHNSTMVLIFYEEYHYG